MRITVFPRIHQTLIGMNSDGYRINGGIGFSISEPKINLEIKESLYCKIIDERTFGFTIEEIQRIVNRLNSIKEEFRFNVNIECHIYGRSLTHFGFGTSTSTYLALIEALFILNKHEYDDTLLQRVSSRGGTSGIGINTYFKGGGVFDIGIEGKAEKNVLAPSSISVDRQLPLVVRTFELPQWRVGIALPKKIKHKSEKEEVDFFKETCPISKRETEHILYEVVYGVLGSLLEKNVKEFCIATNELQKTKWKLEERRLYTPYLEEAERLLLRSGADCVGMSSLGPGLYFMTKDLSNFDYELCEDDMEVFFTDLNNLPRIIEND